MKRRRPATDRRRRRLAIGAAVAVVLLLLRWLLTPAPWTRAELLDAIRFVESSGRADVPDGDNGLAIGPYQIHRVYWQDAVAFRPELGGSYEDCRGRGYAERVLAAYMTKWVPDAWEHNDAEVVARTHNGGPQGAQKRETLDYWRRVRAARR